MIEVWQVKKVSDLMLMIVPSLCPANKHAACDTCSYSKVEFKPGIQARKSLIEIGYVSCVYSAAKKKTGSVFC